MFEYSFYYVKKKSQRGAKMFLDIFGINVCGVVRKCFKWKGVVLIHMTTCCHMCNHTILCTSCCYSHTYTYCKAPCSHILQTRHSLLASPWEIHCGSQCEFGSSRFQPKSEGDGKLCWSCKDVAQTLVC